MIYGFTYLTARRLICDPVLAALATFSFTSIYVFGYFSHVDLTHTTALSAFLAASWYVFVRLCETPTLPWYLALGLCFGLGTLGKWNFVMFAAALSLACLAHPAYRRLVLSWKVVPAAAVAAVIVLPTVVWALRAGPAPGDDVGGLLGRSHGSFLVDLTKGTADLAVSVLAYPMPFLVLFLIFFGGAAWAGLHDPSRPPGDARPGPRHQAAGDGHGHCDRPALAARAPCRCDRFRGTPVAAGPADPADLSVHARGAGGARPHALGPYALTLAAVAAVALAARVGIHAAGGDYCRGTCRTLIPFQDVAAGLRGAGFQGRGTIVARDVQAGGNLRVQFPKARVLETGYPPRSGPSLRERAVPCRVEACGQ